MIATVEYLLAGQTATTAVAGDFILVPRHDFASSIVGLGEWLRFGTGHWAHTAYCVSPTGLIEARGRGVKRTPLSYYSQWPYALVHTHLDPHDVVQANAFAESCVGQAYGWLTDLGIALRFLTPGRGLWFGMNGTEICSGLVAQAQVRGDMNFKVAPASISPTELGLAYGARR